jgi:hypothetical protein
MGADLGHRAGDEREERIAMESGGFHAWSREESSACQDQTDRCSNCDHSCRDVPQEDGKQSTSEQNQTKRNALCHVA